MMVTVLVVWKGRKGRKRRKSSVDEEAGDDPFHEGWSSVPCGSYSPFPEEPCVRASTCGSDGCRVHCGYSGDEELDTLVKATIAGGGVVPYIQPTLIGKNGEEEEEKEMEMEENEEAE